MRSLTIEQARALLKAAEGTKYGPVLAVALTTGMRPSEYLGLKWQDIDWARQTVSVVRSIRRLNGKWCFSDTKRLRSRRPIKLQSWIVTLLRDLRTKAGAQDLYSEAHDLVFRTPSDSQSMRIISPSISDQYSTLLACRASGSMTCVIRRPRSRWQPGCRPKLFLSSWDTRARLLRWILMLTFFHTCRTRLPQE
jgi:Phage integrase family